ncbi:MAG: tetratricopeptide repeat protein [Balneolaceae bacterium]|nr:tetratricopeptide repeat protein [Balneolaceae bacterium]
MLKVLGRVEQALGDFTLSAQLLKEALTKTRELKGRENLDAATIAGMLGEVLRWNGDFKSAEALQREALDIRTRFIQGDDPETAETMDRLARTLEMLAALKKLKFCTATPWP